MCVIFRFAFGVRGEWGACVQKYSEKDLNSHHMPFTFKDDIVTICQQLLPVNCVPFDIRVLILSYSGHLSVGKRSVSWVLFS